MPGLPLFFDFSSDLPSDDPAAQEDQVRRLLAAEGATAAVETLRLKMGPEALASLPDAAREFSTKLGERLRVEDLVELLVPIYTAHLTPKDVKALVAFYESADGRRLVAAQRLIQSDMTPVLFAWLERISTQVREDLLADPKSAHAQTRRMTNEAATIRALVTIIKAQSVFREGDKDGDGDLNYGTLAALAKAKLIDDELGAGRKHGYLFECEPSSNTREDKHLFCWWATAFPEKPGATGDRFFFNSHRGVLLYSREPFEVNKDTCEPMARLTPLGG